MLRRFAPVRLRGRDRVRPVAAPGVRPAHPSVRRTGRRAAVSLAASLAVLLAAATAEAQTRPRPADEPASAGATFVTPFPAGDVYRLQLYGDSLAEGLTAALADVMAGEQRVAVQRKHRPIGALIRNEWEDDIRADEAPSRETVHIAVIMLGLSDRQIIRPASGGRPLSIGSDEWREEYGRRLDRLITSLKKRNIAVYVVGQAVLRQPAANAQAEMLSEIMRQRATANGARFIDIHETFQDDGGGFTQFAPDLTGNRVKMRDGDGVTFTFVGYRHLAHFVQKEIKRDVDQAVSDRAIPLAGDEAEQRRVNPAKAAGPTAASAPTGWKGAVTFAGQARPAVVSQVPVAPSGDQSGDQKADNGRISVRVVGASGREETVAIDIVRPAIPAAVIALVTRRETGPEKPAQPGEPVVEDIGGGLTVVNSVSSLGEGGTGRRRQAPQQTAFQTVLLKGERLKPKPGRADDFAWPRNDAVVPEPARPQPAAAPAGRANVQPGPAAPSNVPRPPSTGQPAPRPPLR